MPRMFWPFLLVGYLAAIGGATIDLPPGVLAPLLPPLALAAALVCAGLAMLMLVSRAKPADGRRRRAAPAAPARLEPRGPRAVAVADGSPSVTPEEVRRALADGRVEVHLQPIVSLPQRRTAFFEAFTRLRLGDGALAPPACYLPVALRAGLIGRIDALLLLRAAQLIGRTTARGQVSRVFVNVASASLADPAFVAEVAELLRARPERAAGLILELDHLALDAKAAHGLAMLQGHGVGLSLDRLPTGPIDPVELARRGFTFLKLDARRFKDDRGRARLDADLLALHRGLQAAGITTIVQRIGSERELAEVLDYPVRFGQGELFGRPVPVAA